MQLEVRPCASTAEFAAAASMIEQYVGEVVDIERAERYLRIVPLERMHAAFDGSNVVGAAGAHRFDLSVPGARVQCAGITSVGVQPTHRRRGVLRSLMRAQLDAVHARGEPIAALWSSEETIYERFGYGLASWSGQIAVPRERARFAHPLEDGGTIRLVEPDEARTLLPPVWQELMTQRPGVFSRSPEWWELRVVADRPERRGGAGPKRFVVAEREGAVRGYAIYRHKPSWEQGVPAGELRVWEAIGADARATAALWRYLLDVDWTATIHASLLPPDHPLLLLAAEPRRLRYRLGDGLWIRLVDVRAALAGRMYAADEPLVLELTDSFCPWNAGRWRLAGSGATATDEEPDLRLDVAALGSAYLGGISFRELAGALRIEELRTDAVARADALFRAPAHPWCPEIF
jgi:predicted acetyltransferase